MILLFYYQQLLQVKKARDERIFLRLTRVEKNIIPLGEALCLTFAIVDQQSKQVAGALGLRVGESDALFYLGHIGYHVDPPFRGDHYALRACQLCLPMAARLGMRSLSITTDEDNLPSIRTCEALGCRYESTVDVPDSIHQKFQISNRKRRYVLIFAYA